MWFEKNHAADAPDAKATIEVIRMVMPMASYFLKSRGHLDKVSVSAPATYHRNLEKYFGLLVFVGLFIFIFFDIYNTYVEEAQLNLYYIILKQYKR